MVRKAYRDVPFKHRVLSSALSRPSSTVSEVLGDVGRYVSATRAVQAADARYRRRVSYDMRRRGHCGCRRPDTTRLIETGKRELVRWALRRLVSEGKLVRLSVGVYGPPLPHVYNPNEKEVG
jgi:hypothetical protein